MDGKLALSQGRIECGFRSLYAGFSFSFGGAKKGQPASPENSGDYDDRVEFCSVPCQRSCTKGECERTLIDEMMGDGIPYQRGIIAEVHFAEYPGTVGAHGGRRDG